MSEIKINRYIPGGYHFVIKNLRGAELKNTLYILGVYHFIIQKNIYSSKVIKDLCVNPCYTVVFQGYLFLVISSGKIAKKSVLEILQGNVCFKLRSLLLWFCRD